jgi:hypothetical protein
MLKSLKNVSDADVKSAVKKVKNVLGPYVQMMTLFPQVDVSKDALFQRKLKSVNKFMFLEEGFVSDYFDFLQKHKNDSLDFIDTLKYFREKHGKYFYSYVSKILAIIDPTLPVWDSTVRSVFGFKNPDELSSDDKRIKKAKFIYGTLLEWYKNFLASEQGLKWIGFFDEVYPDSNITAIKKINLILGKLMIIKKNARYAD